MLLNMANHGELMKVIRVAGRDKVRGQLLNLGFCEGSCVRVVSEVNGNYIVQVKDTRIGIGRELAQKITVVPVQENEAHIQCELCNHTTT